MDADKSNPQVGSWFKVSRRDRPSGSKRFHYQWESEDGETGFVVHKRNGKGFKMFLDSNDDGLFDRNDALISRGPLQDGFDDVRPGRLLGKGEEGIITAEAYIAEGHDDHEGDHDHDHDHDHEEHHHDDEHALKGINALGWQHMSFFDLDMNEVFHDHGAAHNHDYADHMA